MFFVCKQMTAYDVRISDWSSDVCSSELADPIVQAAGPALPELPLVRDDPVAAPVRRPRHLVGKALVGGGQVPGEVLTAGHDLRLRRSPRPPDRKSGVLGKRVSASVNPGGRRNITKTNKTNFKANT